MRSASGDEECWSTSNFWTFADQPADDGFEGQGAVRVTRIVFVVMMDVFGNDGSIYEVLCRFCTAMIPVYALVHEPIFFALTAPLAGADAFPI